MLSSWSSAAAERLPLNTRTSVWHWGFHCEWGTTAEGPLQPGLCVVVLWVSVYCSVTAATSKVFSAWEWTLVSDQISVFPVRRGKTSVRDWPLLTPWSLKPVCTCSQVVIGAMFQPGSAARVHGQSLLSPAAITTGYLHAHLCHEQAPLRMQHYPLYKLQPICLFGKRVRFTSGRSGWQQSTRRTPCLWGSTSGWTHWGSGGHKEQTGFIEKINLKCPNFFTGGHIRQCGGPESWGGGSKECPLTPLKDDNCNVNQRHKSTRATLGGRPQPLEIICWAKFGPRAGVWAFLIYALIINGHIKAVLSLPWGRAGLSWCWAAGERWWWRSGRRCTRPASRATAGSPRTGWW